MIKITCPTLKRGSPHKNCVEQLQRILNSVARPGDIDLSVDGDFGTATDRRVKQFQRARGLTSDGIVGQGTWAELDRLCYSHEITWSGSPNPEVAPSQELIGFYGDLSWIHQWEGHKGFPYWPRSLSGVTLDPGCDLGQIDQSVVIRAYKSLLTSDEMDAVLRLVQARIRGPKARMWLSSAREDSAIVRGIRISRSEAISAMSVLTVPYWEAVTKKFEMLLDPPTLGTDTLRAALHTVFLSLAYNRGTAKLKKKRSRDEPTQITVSLGTSLTPLRDALLVGDYARVGNLVKSMQQDHELEGIRIRRRAEGQLILDALPPSHAQSVKHVAQGKSLRRLRG